MNVGDWIPKTKLGKLVADGTITTMEEALDTNLPILEPEIVDTLLPGLKHHVLDSTVTIRVTDSGRRRSFRVAVVVGNENGYVGMGIGKGNEYRSAFESALRKAKLNITRIRRGCGSWECGCGTPHSVPFRVEGKASSVRVTLLPAPKGVGLAAPDSVKPVLQLAGIKDVWERARGNTRTTINFAAAVIDALKGTTRTKLPRSALSRVGVDW